MMVLAKLSRKQPVLAPLNGQEELYHGIPVFDMHVGDPILMPRAPLRYAVRVTPDLARYLLTFNHPENRRLRPRKIKNYARDMAAGRWPLTPESIVFSSRGILQNGQNRLMAVTEYGAAVWFTIDFGWAEDIIAVIDRGNARTNLDALHVTGHANGANIASAVTKVWQYDRTVGTTRLWAGYEIPSAAEVLAMVDADDEGWQAATHAAMRVYRALDKGGAASYFAAVHHLIAREHGDRADDFFEEIATGSGKAGSATRVIGDWYRRRPASQTRTGDSREPIELLIRAFNGWLNGKSFAFTKYKGFPLSRVRSEGKAA